MDLQLGVSKHYTEVGFKWVNCQSTPTTRVLDDLVFFSSIG